MKKKLVYVGLDIAKATLDLSAAGAAHTFAHDEAGCAALIAHLRSLRVPCHVI